VRVVEKKETDIVARRTTMRSVIMSAAPSSVFFGR